MKLNEFLDKLAALNPPPAVLRNEGLTEDIVQLVARAYQIRPKDDQPVGLEGNAIMKLVEDYESEYIRFGDYAFMDKVKLVDGLSVFAMGTFSYLGYAYTDSEIIEYDFEERTVRGACAKDIPSFLEALLCVMELRSKRLQGVHKDDREVNKAYLAKSAAAAGGVKYWKFYEKIIYG